MENWHELKEEKKEIKCEEYEERFINSATKCKHPVRLRTLYKYLIQPDMISLSGGLPHPSIFPFANLTFRLIGEDKEYKIEKEDFDSFLQYGSAGGHELLLKKVIQITERCFNPVASNRKTIMTTGNTEGADVVMRVILEREDTLLLEEFSYPTFFNTAEPFQANILQVPMDEEGIIPSELEKYCELAKEQNKPVKCLFTVPVGHNPTGRSSPIARKIQIYLIARKYNFLIIEDDPYYFLQYASDDYEREIVENDMPGLISTMSYLSIDFDGRVIRLDSFSKIIAPGMRCGWMTAPAPIIDKIITYLDSSSQQPSGFTQSILYKILDSWSEDRLHQYLQNVQYIYNLRRNSLLKAIYKYKLDQYAKIEIPNAGMFIWVTLKENIDTLKLFNDLLSSNVMFVPGCFFGYDKQRVSNSFRMTFASATVSDFDEAIHRFVDFLANQS